MKGLLLKDLLVLLKLCRTQLIICLLFVVIAIATNSSIMLVYVPVLLSTMPINLVTTDEISHWDKYSIALPFTKKEVVSSKYVFSLIIAVISIVFSIAAAVFIGGGKNEIMSAIVGACFFSVVTPAVMYPLIFRYGSATAKIGYYVIIGIMAAVIFAILNVVDDKAQFTFIVKKIMEVSPMVLGAMTLFYAASWFFCGRMYEKRDL